MRILVHAVNYRPEIIGPAKYTTEMCEWLASRGHEVAVIVPPPYYPNWRITEPYSQWRYSSSFEGGVRVRRAPIWIPKRPSGFARVLHFSSFAIASIPILFAEARRHPDVVLVTEPSFLNLPVAWLAARICGARAWLHIQDFEVDLAYGLGQIRTGRRLAARIEDWLTQRFDVVSSIAGSMLDRARGKTKDGQELLLFPNWVDVDAIYPVEGPNRLRHSLEIPESCPVALYAGSLGAKQGVEAIVEAARILGNRPVHFVICGEGIAAASLRASAGGLDNVSFLPLQAPDRLNELLNLADIHLLPQQKGTEGLLLPSKLTGMFASGRPVVAMCGPESDLARLIEGRGIRVDHGNTTAFAAAIEQLTIGRSERLEMGRRAREHAVANLHRDVVLRKFEVALEAESSAFAHAASQSYGD